MRWKLASVIALTLVMASAVSMHAQWPSLYPGAHGKFDGLNGGFYWKWTWRRLSWLRLYPPMLAAVVPFVVGQWLQARQKRVKLALWLVALSTFALQFAAIGAQPPYGLNRPIFAVQNSVITSYYTAATFVKKMPLSDWLPVYDRFLGQLMIHARFKPPGPILFYWMLFQIVGEGRAAALIGATIVALLAAAAVPATYRLVKHFAQDADAAFCAASFMALCPSLILFFPQFDQTYPIMVCGLLIVWSLALKTGKLYWAAATGALLALMLFFSYFFLVLVVFMGVMTLLHVGERRAAGFGRAAAMSVIVGGVVVLFYVAIWAIWGFDPILTAETIRIGQAADLVLLSRPFPYHMPFDAMDVALGTGWISVLLVAFYVASIRGKLFNLFHHSPAVRLTFLALLQVVTILAAAILPGEGARLFLPLMPLVAAVAGLELQRWPTRARMSVYACLFVATCVICQNMIFFYAGIEIEGVPR